jgi:hypothetical protein
MFEWVIWKSKNFKTFANWTIPNIKLNFRILTKKYCFIERLFCCYLRILSSIILILSLRYIANDKKIDGVITIHAVASPILAETSPAYNRQ